MRYLSTSPAKGDIVFECARVKSIELLGKKGVITPDADGCYTQVIGALGAFNSAGDYYDVDAGRRFFLSQSAFQRRLEKGALKAEWGHPKREAGMSRDDYAARIMDIREDRMCGTWRKIWLSQEKMKDPQGRYLIPILGKIYPSGYYKDALIHAFESAGENVCFSIRSFTRDAPCNKGYYVKKLEYIVTFDYVNEPGISVAEKMLSPTLESYEQEHIDAASLLGIIDNKKGYGIESASLEDFKERLEAIKKEEQLTKGQSKSNFIRW